jgi:hypothetical protein
MSKQKTVKKLTNELRLSFSVKSLEDKKMIKKHCIDKSTTLRDIIMGVVNLKTKNAK